MSNDEQAGAWVFSVVDIVGAMIQQRDFRTARTKRNKLKERLKKEGRKSVGDQLSPTETGGGMKGSWL